MKTELVLEGKDIIKESEGQRKIPSVPDRIRPCIIIDFPITMPAIHPLYFGETDREQAIF